MRKSRSTTRALGMFATIGVMLATFNVSSAPASAYPTPAGPMTLHLRVTETLLLNGVPTDIGPMSGTAKGAIDGVGRFAFREADIEFSPYDASLAGNLTQVRVVPTASWTGTVDALSGNVSLTGSSNLVLSIPSLGVADCPLGPTQWNLFSNNYKVNTGKALVSDPAFVIPALDGSDANCANQDASINTEFGLPGNAEVRAGLTFSPIEGTLPNPPFPSSTITTTTVTIAPTTTSVGLAPRELPRTGSPTTPVAVVGGALVLSGLALTVRRRARRA